MSIIGPPLYEWFSHNLALFVIILGSLVTMILFLVNTSRKKGRYRS